MNTNIQFPLLPDSRHNMTSGLMFLQSGLSCHGRLYLLITVEINSSFLKLLFLSGIFGHNKEKSN